MTSDRADLLRQLGDEIAAFQESTDAFDAAVAQRLGVNRTDLRCLGLVVQEIGSTTPSVLATRLGLSSGSVTTMLDRLEQKNYLVRTRDPDDRRKVMVHATDDLRARAEQLYGPLVADGRRALERYTEAELTLMVDFLRRSRQQQYTHLSRVRTT